MAMRRARAGGVNLSREVDVPLPVRGLFQEAKSGEVSGMYAAELHNWRSNGSSIELRQASSLQTVANSVLQRIPFEFGPTPQMIDVRGHKLQAGQADFPYASGGDLSVGYISENAVIVGGDAGPVRFDGSEFAASTFTTDTGLDPALFDGFIAHHDRPFFWQRGQSLDFYYGGVGAIQGDLTRFPLGRLGNITGTLLSLRSATVDAGHGMNDVLVILTTSGHIIAYEGLDPGNSNDWRQLSRMKVIPPVSHSAFVEVGADLWMLTSQGVVSLLETLRSSRLALVNTVSRPVQDDLAAQIKEGGEWSMHITGDGSMVIINRVWNGSATQHILSTDSDSWFTADYDARDWHNLIAETTFTDLVGNVRALDDSAQEDITARWVSSWFRLPRAGGIEYITPTILARGALTMKVTVLSDHDETQSDITEAEQTLTIQPDDPADPDGKVAINEEIGIDAVGSVFQIRIEVTAKWAEIVSVKAALT